MDALRRTYRHLRYGAVFAASFIALLFERLWNAFWGALTVVLFFIALSLFGFFTALSTIAHLVLLTVFIVAAALAVFFVGDVFRFPRRRHVERKIEAQSGLLHRPLETLRDRPAAGIADPVLWRRHIATAARDKQRIRPYRPVSRVPAQDRFSLRHAAFLLVVAGFFVAGNNAPARLERALLPDVDLTLRGQNVDIWIAPPDYTDRQPVYLARNGEVFDITAAVPENSVVKIRIGGMRFAPRVSLDRRRIRMTGDNNNYTGEFPIKDSGTLRAYHFLLPIGTWKIDVTPDLPPAVELIAAAGNDRNALRLSYQASDDFGIAHMTATITDPAAPPNSNAVVTFDIPAAATKTPVMTHVQDLTFHPLAGSPVDIQLTATDGAGNRRESNTLTVVLPERRFRNPVAARIAFERKRLISFPSALSRRFAVDTLAEIVNRPINYRGDPMTFLHLATAMKRLARDRDGSNTAGVIAHLWDIALRIEDGGLTEAAHDLSAALQDLSDTLADKKSTRHDIEEKIAAVQNAMRAYITTMAHEMRSRMAADNRPLRQMSPEVASRMMQHMDLKSLIEQMQALREGTAREQMQKLAQMLKDSVDNFDLNRMEEMRERQQQTIDMLEDMQAIINAQQAILDKTRKAQNDDDIRDQAVAQKNNRAALDNAVAKVKSVMHTTPENFIVADAEMKFSGDNLDLKRLETALTHQKKALDALQQGMDDMAAQMAQEMQQMLSMGLMPAGSGFGGERDPLGREQPAASDVKIPDETERRRVQDILRELRKRANEYDRPDIEREYIDRLLDPFR